MSNSVSTESEEQVRRFVRGDEGAFNRLVELWETKVYNLAWRYLGNREDAQDVVQETFLSVFRNIRSLREPRSFSSWLFRITLNHCRARWRVRSPDVSLDNPVPGGRDEVDGLTFASLASPEAVDRLELRDLIRKSLLGVSEEQRSAIILKEYMGLSLEELAGVMNCPLSTAKSRLYHGLRSVQRNLKRLGVR